MGTSSPGRFALRPHNGRVLVLLALWGCSVPQAGRELATLCGPGLSPRADDMELAVHERVNRERASMSLSPLTWDDRLAAAARAHSRAMAAGEVPVGHAGFQQRVQALSACVGVMEAAENVTVLPLSATRSLLPVMAVSEWLQSPPHRATLFGEYHHLSGVGIASDGSERQYVTQIYIRTR